MNKAKIFLTLGVWVAVLPYLGFPLVIKNTLFTLTGLALIYLAYIVRRESRASGDKDRSADTFSERKVKKEFKDIKELKEEKEIEENTFDLKTDPLEETNQF